MCMTFKVESVAHNITHYDEVLEKYDVIYHVSYGVFGTHYYATIELLTLGDLLTFQEELGQAVVIEEGDITIYDGYME